MLSVRKHDKVKVLWGKDKGKEGEVIAMDPANCTNFCRSIYKPKGCPVILSVKGSLLLPPARNLSVYSAELLAANQLFSSLYFIPDESCDFLIFFEKSQARVTSFSKAALSLTEAAKSIFTSGFEECLPNIPFVR